MEICRDVVGKCTGRSDVGYLILSIVGCAAEFVWKIVIPLYEGIGRELKYNSMVVGETTARKEISADTATWYKTGRR